MKAPEANLTPAQRIGRRLKAEREHSGMTQREAAERLGVHQPAVADWEAGRKVPPLVRLYEIIDILGLDEARILLRPESERNTTRLDRRESP
jgi:transcriptional regulator with XRE-family HTH domain